MKVKVIMKWPEWNIMAKEVEVDVPDEVENVDNWIYDHGEELLEKESRGEVHDLSGAIDMGYAGVEVIKNKDNP